MKLTIFIAVFALSVRNTPITKSTLTTAATTSVAVPHPILMTPDTRGMERGEQHRGHSIWSDPELVREMEKEDREMYANCWGC
jgi:hypothetical protein